MQLMANTTNKACDIDLLNQVMKLNLVVSSHKSKSPTISSDPVKCKQVEQAMETEYRGNKALVISSGRF